MIYTRNSVVFVNLSLSMIALSLFFYRQFTIYCFFLFAIVAIDFFHVIYIQKVSIFMSEIGEGLMLQGVNPMNMLLILMGI